MSRIFKSVTVETEQSITLNTICWASAGPANSDPLELPFESVAAPHPPVENPATPDTEVATLLTEAQNHVEMMLGQAQLQVSTWQEEAQREGWQAGYDEGQRAIEAELAEALTTARNLAQAAKEAHREFLRQNQAGLGELAVAIAQKIMGKELTVNPKIITDMVAQTIKMADIRGACTIRVHPKDYEIMEPYWEAVPSLQPPGAAWELVADQRVNRGGCFIETGGGVIDATLETQLEQVAAAFQA